MSALRVGLTGGIGAGKSLALSEFARLGAATTDADEIARAQARPGGLAFRRIVRVFGRSVLAEDGTIDRRKLAERVFAAPAARLELERLTHPLVMTELRRKMKAARGIVVAAVPLLFEARLEREFDVTVSVEAPAGARARRAARRDGAARAGVLARIAAQLTESQRRSRADIVLRNDGSPKRFLATVRRYHSAFALLRHGARGAS